VEEPTSTPIMYLLPLAGSGYSFSIETAILPLPLSKETDLISHPSSRNSLNLLNPPSILTGITKFLRGE